MASLTRSPTVQTLSVMAVVFLAQRVAGLVGAMGFLFVLGPSFPLRPWALLTSIYAHGSLAHLLGNATMLVLVGLLVESFTSSVRYHAFFVTTGVLSGLAQITLVSGSRVLGASGAIFAFLGYLVAANPVSSSVLDTLRLSRRGQLALFALLAVAVTLLTGAPGVAVVAHFTGFLLGLLAGRLGVLATSRPRGQTQGTSGPPG
ncbi:rhomboid family intramembrane serine protease [Halococcus sp. AFM35]|uniref:rhomboid family intramembrane serine protease n=1 Tax=Halococcus sp. AFM35 TaxID=3421653 RepID=UPI003EBDFBF0